MGNDNERIITLLRRAEERDRVWLEKYGHVKNLVTWKWKDHRIVCVGSDIHYGREWKSFHDFLLDYIWILCDQNWVMRQYELEVAQRHVVLQWHDSLKRFTENSSRDEFGFYKGEVCGACRSILDLSYDLYTLRHHQRLQDRVLQRLFYSRGQFQGARHELFAAATVIRAGMEIDFEDESDLSSKHLEFTAIDKVRSQVWGIEAKSKHRHGALGFSTETKKINSKPGVKELLLKAQKKSDEHPLVVFVDLNLPGSQTSEELNDRYRDVVHEVGALYDGDVQETPFNLLVFTNSAAHYNLNDTDFGNREIFFMQSSNPLHANVNIGSLNAISRATTQWGQVPTFFPDEEYADGFRSPTELFNFANALVEREVESLLQHQRLQGPCLTSMSEIRSRKFEIRLWTVQELTDIGPEESVSFHLGDALELVQSIDPTHQIAVAVADLEGNSMLFRKTF